MIIMALRMARVSDLRPARPSLLLSLIGDIYFPDISVLRSFNMFFAHPNGATYPNIRALVPQVTLGSKLKLQGLTFNFN